MRGSAPPVTRILVLAFLAGAAIGVTWALLARRSSHQLPPRVDISPMDAGSASGTGDER